MHGSEGLHEMRGLEGVGGGGLSGCMGQRDYMRGGGLSTPSGVVGLVKLYIHYYVFVGFMLYLFQL